MIIDKIEKTNKKNALISKGDKILIGLSGGADSVCLTHALVCLKEKYNITLFTAHLNHGIRGEEAERDENFVKAFSESLGIKCFTLKADIPAIAKERKQSEETAGRQVRYEFFNKICAENGIDKIATAHNRNDNAETLLMNFMRGSGLSGLCGIPYRRDNIIRPILDVTREKIEAYCRENGLQYVTDSTNNTLDYTRNKIRHIFLPLIENDFNGNFVNTVSQNAGLIREDKEYIEKAAKTEYNKIVINSRADIQSLLSLDNAVLRRVIRLMLKDKRQSLADMPSVYIEDVISILGKDSGTSVNLSDGFVARIEYGFLIIDKDTEKTDSFSYSLGIGESLYIPELNKTVKVSAAENRIKDGAIYLGLLKGAKVTVRNRREGDVFSPYGMTGSKKVKEYFINSKIPRGERDRVPIIEINGRIAAVGDRIDRSFLFEDKGIKIEFI